MAGIAVIGMAVGISYGLGSGFQLKKTNVHDVLAFLLLGKLSCCRNSFLSRFFVCFLLVVSDVAIYIAVVLLLSSCCRVVLVMLHVPTVVLSYCSGCVVICTL